MNTQSSMALWGEGGREGEGEREREREREREGRTEKYEYRYVACGAINLPPSQMEKADHQCETINAKLSLQILQYENEHA